MPLNLGYTETRTGSQEVIYRLRPRGEVKSISYPRIKKIEHWKKDPKPHIFDLANVNFNF